MTAILIVEDEPDMATGLQDNLEFEGYSVRIARDGEEALASAAEFPPNLILMDLMLPRRNGLDVCRELRRRGVTVPIVMLTARSQETDKVVGLEIGADDYVTKPFSVRELMAREASVADIRRVIVVVPTVHYQPVAPLRRLRFNRQLDYGPRPRGYPKPTSPVNRGKTADWPAVSKHLRNSQTTGGASGVRRHLMVN